MIADYLTSSLIPLPHILTIEITSYCNLDCVMCPKTAGYVNTAENRVIPLDIVEKLQPVLDRIDGVDLSGLWGEAFLHPDLYIEILNILKKRHIGVRTVTNGTLITDEIAEKLVSLGLDSLEVSIDAATAATYAGIRTGGDFEAVKSGLRAINLHKKKRRSPYPRVKLLFLGMTDNIHELPEFVTMAHSVGAECVVLQAMGEYEKMEGRSIALRDKNRGIEYYEAAKRIAQSLNISIELFPPDQFQPREGPEYGGRASRPDGKTMVTKDCFFPWDRAVISAEGKILPCCAATKPFGDLGADSFVEIWYGKAYVNLRSALLTGALPLMCERCTGQGWRSISAAGRFNQFYRMERARMRQRLRRSTALRRVKNLIKR
jgi:MoaA/NifB/PqqE/SkfB family radical SAM enzyme